MAAVVTTTKRSRGVGFTTADAADCVADDDCAAHLDKDLRCPVSLEVMKDPVLLAQSGVSYEREYLVKCLAERPGVDPQTNARFSGSVQYPVLFFLVPIPVFPRACPEGGVGGGAVTPAYAAARIVARDDGIASLAVVAAGGDRLARRSCSW